MRRWRRVVAAAALSTVALAGCAPAGLDGDLTDDWRPIAEARQFSPKAGDCHLIANASSYLTSYQPVGCDRAHLVETIHLGTFTGALADRPTPPPADSAAIRPAFAECDAKATAFVGGDWRGARLTIQVVPPSPAGWQGGARWFRCDMYELSMVDGADFPIQHSGTLRDALEGNSPLAYGCLTAYPSGDLRQSACRKSHQYEYVGSWTAPDGRYADADRNPDSIHGRCRTLVARYAKVPVDGMLRYRTGTSFRLPSPEAWARGDRGIRCFFWSSGQKMTRSIKGGGTRMLPVN